MIRLFIAVLPVLAANLYADETNSPAAAPQRIALWDGHAPIGGGEFEEAEAWVTIYRVAKHQAPAMVICPGGGYGGLVTGAEGHGIAKWLNHHGVAGAVLEYRLPNGRPYVPLLDAQRAIRTLRVNARRWDIDAARVGIIGFSAGGHLASTAGTHFDNGDKHADEAIDRAGCRPDFVLLVYPVITMGEKTHQGSKDRLLGKKPSPKLVEIFSSEKQVTRRTPPTFLAHALDDTAVPAENSKSFYEALVAQKIPCEYLELPSGGHGLDGYKGPMWEAWQEKSLLWLARQKFIQSDGIPSK